MVNFGPLSAEADPDLLNYFHLTKQAQAIVTFKAPSPTFILIARPGGGKTALRKWLEKKASTDLTIGLTSDRTRLQLDGQDEPNAGDLRLLIESELITGIASEAVERNAVSGKLRTETEQYIEKGWTKILGTFFAQKFSGMSILGCGFTLKPGERRQYLQKVRQSSQVSDLSAQVKKIAATKRILLVVDNPEEIVGNGLNDVSPDNAVRVGALLSVLGRVHQLGVTVVCFLKEQIFQAVRDQYPDVSHFMDGVDGLSWSSEDLVDLLESRVTKKLKLTWNQVFEVPKDALVADVFPYLSNGPRDLLTLCNLAGAKSSTIGRTDLLGGVKVLKANRLKDLSAQYKQWQKFDLFTAALVTALREKYKSGSIPVGGIVSAFNEQYAKPKSTIHGLRSMEWVDRARWEPPAIDERLFLAGIVGYVQENGTKVYPWSGRDTAQLQQAKSHFVSPLFWQ